MTPDPLLYRQIHPLFLCNDQPTSQAFGPTSKDEGFLSVDHGDMISPEEAYRQYTVCCGYDSAGVMAVTLLECHDIGLSVAADPKPSRLAHHVVDFTCCSKSKSKTKAKKLKRLAIDRGWQYCP